MAKCKKCAVDVAKEDLYEDHGLQVCEDCKLKSSVSPPESCATKENMIK